MSEVKSAKAVYSYHTFIFPFLWNNGGDLSLGNFEKCIDKTCWKLDLFDEFHDKIRIDDLRKERYDQYQYFNSPARRAIYTASDNSKNEIVNNYLYKPELFAKADTGAFYVIKKGETAYRLHINSLRLKLYNSGIGLLVYELENTDYKSIEDVNRINEYGRRIYCPYIYGTDNPASFMTADSISMEGADFPTVDDSEWRIAADVSDKQKAPETVLAKVVTMLLTNGDISATTDEKEAKQDRDKLYIEPIIDDRMFVACFVRDESFAGMTAEWSGGEYRWLSDAADKAPDAKDNMARKLYEFVFVDGNGITCLNRTLLRSSLERHIYSRWAEYGTIHGVTEYSMVCVSSAEENYIAENPFLTQYVEIAMLVLAQRASLIAFERQISLVSKNFKKARKMMETYVRFQSQLLLTEVTPQQQGIELYDMLQDNLFVNKQKDDVENQIQNLFALKNFIAEKRENVILFAISILGAICAFDELKNVLCNFINFIIGLFT